jgi:PAS domain S-box-containing protein
MNQTDFLLGGGEMGERIRAYDWACTPLGPPAAWPRELKTAVRIILTARQPMFVWWGPQLINLYNDAYRAVLGGRHPGALGQPAAGVWAEIWPEIGPRADSVMRRNEGTFDESLLLVMQRNGYPEETYYTFSYSPLPGPDGRASGLFAVCTEDTRRIVGERQQAVLRELAAAAPDAHTLQQACVETIRRTAADAQDLPFALIYLVDGQRRTAHLAASAGIAAGHRLAPASIHIADDSPWRLAPLLADEASAGPGASAGEARADPQQGWQLQDLAGAADVPAGPWPQPPRQAACVAIARAGSQDVAGVLIAGLNPYRLADDGYQDFLRLVAAQIASNLAAAHGHEEERRRMEAMAELDRTKTQFFSNVSHEFRTPLTLLLGPLEEVSALPADELGSQAATLVGLAYRNAQRLLRLVNTLLDFSRIEAGRLQAVYEPVDLPVLTAELAGVFRSAVEKAGLTLTVDCPPLGEPVYVDRDMWERIVLNLLSNALKFTLEGGIRISLQREEGQAVLEVADTGVGIPAEEIGKLFNRFHRVASTRGRSQEGTGIGLALIRELAGLHKGTVTVHSEIGHGSRFRVCMPLGSAHLPVQQLGRRTEARPPAIAATPYVEEALRWLPDRRGIDAEAGLSSETLARAPQSAGPRPHVLVVDDNADMRGYLQRLLSTRYDVTTANDGEQALEAIRAQLPDLVLSDVMMPRLDGFGLLKAVRASADTSRLPVVLLSARAGEEARIEGLGAQADDYIVKPFSARELLARVDATIRLARTRHEAQAQVLEEARITDTLNRIGELLAAERDLPRLLQAVTDAATRLTEAQFGVFFHDARNEEDGSRSACTLSGMDRAAFERLALPPGLAAFDPALRATGIVRSDDLLSDPRHGGQRGAVPAANGVPPVRSYLGVPVATTGGEVLGGLAFGHARPGVFTERHERLIVGIAAQAAIAIDNARLLERLRQNAERLALALSASRLGDWSWSAKNDVITFSARAAEIFGIPAGPHMTRAEMLTMLPEEDALRVRQAVSRAIADGAYYDIEYRVTRPDGKQVWVLSRGGAHYDPQGQVAGMLGVLQDITATKKMERELRVRADALAEADRRKDEFLATLAHELRNPLAPLRNALEIVRRPGIPDAARSQARDIMTRQVAQMSRLIDELLDISRITSGKIALHLETVSLGAVLDAALEIAQPLIQARQHRVQLSLPQEDILLQADKTRLAQVLSNLLNNAAKYTAPDGVITVSARREDGQAAISVHDTGQGIAPDMLPHVFEMFVQGDRATAPEETGMGVGLGVGLTLAKRLTELHGGSLEARSRGLGQGSEFLLRLPLPVAGTQLPMPALPTAQSATPAHASVRRVLVVDDNVDHAHSTAAVLKLDGYLVQTAHHGQEALDLAKRLKPDIVLLDIGLPGMDGFEVARRLRAEPGGADLVLIAITGWGQEKDRERSRQAGFDHHLVKPVDPAHLSELLQSLGSALA